MTGHDVANSHPSRRDQRWSRPSLSLVVLAIALTLFLVLLPGTLLMIFAGILLAVFFRAGGVWLARHLSLRPVWGVALFLLLILLGLALGGTAAAPAISTQIDELWRQIPDAAESLTARIERYAWGREILDRMGEADLWSGAFGGAATQALGSAFGYLGNTVLLLFIALYGAFDPGTYRRGFIKLFAPSLRPQACKVLDESVTTLQSWLSAQLISMSVVGILTGIGLWLIGIPLALVLGLIAGLLAFIPNVGPILAAVPGLLLAVPDGTNAVLMVLAVYLTVQTLESYVITPLVQKEKVSLPPVLVISSQLVFGALFGLIGLAMATPLTALVMQLVDRVYIGAWLERERPNENG
jgi:predicted PurR-regulated permease PerM